MLATLNCGFAQWHAGLGDNNLMGWVTVAVYLVAAWASFRVRQRLEPVDGPARRERLFWAVAAGLMLALAINKQLDLQSLFTVLGRCHAQLAGWYDMRRAVQRVFILSVALGGAVVLALLALLLRGILGRVWPALLGLGFVSLFVLIRAASFHDVDGFLGSWALGIKVNWLLELPGPILVAVLAARRRRAILVD